ncbi:hypothetical protein [Jatrophihabitans sp.]|jgi:hypothetical protein|uniref:hypothetical protein n=1 Tax=Jatrophihabitans sp. TaxID=1932789 RepID=UPI0038CD4F16
MWHDDIVGLLTGAGVQDQHQRHARDQAEQLHGVKRDGTAVIKCEFIVNYVN